ncbi:MAG: ATP-binding cassette domain-containing protein [Oscillospiraceae bacterium]|nr:ATP-binding cassette domain-containing protein [Oscillospiraceae bacterium]
MLLLKNIVKHYVTGDTVVQALRGINLEFRKSEFVSVLGPSGCGKTTMLNIIGGLDRYTSGDLSVDGISTKEFKDGDWDAYRNNSIGFVFQTYNLISHQTVLANVELAMTLSGVSKSKRRQHAVEVLNQVGLGDQIHKKPNQLSGGQMQRVAIARALVNDPEIVLADEPTGALDSETSVQIMEILKEIAKDRLVIMVTHNPDLAEKYSTRIIRLLDGTVISDSNPYSEEEQKKEEKTGKKKKTYMSFFTALSLSLTNLMTKKARTILTSFAGSIGIIGIALIMSLSNGAQNYITRVEHDTLSSYPITIQQSAVDVSALVSASMGMSKSQTDHPLDKIYSNNVMEKMLNTMISQVSTNDLQNFKNYIETESQQDKDSIKSLSSDIQYGYGTTLNIYKTDTSADIVQVNPSNLLRSLGVRGMGGGIMSSGMTNTDIWQQLLDNPDVLKEQYNIIAGRFPEAYDEVMLVVNDKNEITDYTLYSLGLKDTTALTDAVNNIGSDQKIMLNEDQSVYTYDDLLSLTFKLVLNTAFYQKDSDTKWESKKDDDIFMKQVVDNGEMLKVVGIVKPADTSATNMNQTGGYIGYTTALMNHLIDEVNNSEIVKAQEANPNADIFTGLPFSDSTQPVDPSTFDYSVLPADQQAYLATLTDDERSALIQNYLANNKSDATYDGNMTTLGVSDLNNPTSISIYPADFASKDKIIKIIDDYNNSMTAAGNDKYVIHYTDYVGLMMSSVSNIIKTISYILIAFVAISLVVSSIMIGIITYISVLERTKEIGILRSIGAAKGDISRVFNAETLIVGFVAGLIGIGVTLLLCIPANIIIKALTKISGVAALPLLGGIALIIISMILTFIAGLIPSKMAAKKDPVVALRTE